LKVDSIFGVKILFANMLTAIYMLILGVALLFSLRWGVAAVSHEISMYYFHSWSKQGVLPDTDEWERSKKMMVLSVELDSANAEYINDQGRFYLFTADKLLQSETSYDFLLIKAVSNFRLASKLRPMWPDAWVNLSLAKAKLGIIDDEFNQAIANAMARGMASPVIYSAVIELAISQWHKLPAQLKAKVIYQIKVGLENNMKYDVLEVIKAQGLCLELEQEGLSGGC